MEIFSIVGLLGGAATVKAKANGIEGFVKQTISSAEHFLNVLGISLGVFVVLGLLLAAFLGIRAFFQWKKNRHVSQVAVLLQHLICDLAHAKAATRTKLKNDTHKQKTVHDLVTLLTQKKTQKYCSAHIVRSMQKALPAFATNRISTDKQLFFVQQWLLIFSPSLR